MDGVSKPLKTATYLLRMTPEDKAELEQKVRVAAARGHSPLTLAEALRMGAHAMLDELLEKLPAIEDGTEARDEHVPAS
jgi:hypothetical protein